MQLTSSSSNHSVCVHLYLPLCCITNINTLTEALVFSGFQFSADLKQQACDYYYSTLFQMVFAVKREVQHEHIYAFPQSRDTA